MIYRIVFAPEARDGLDRLHGLIPDAADADITSRFAAEISRRC